MSERDNMVGGRLYAAADEELCRVRKYARRLTRLYNATTEEEQAERERLIRSLFGHVGAGCVIEPAFRCDYGFNISVGECFYANFDCIILDVCPVTIGDRVMLGPRVCIYTASHPLDAGIRGEGLECGRPVGIGDDVWIGGNTVINPGVVIGNNVVIGAGSVVTKDIPDNVIAFGTPCHVWREIGDEDAAYWRSLKLEWEAGRPGSAEFSV